LSIALSQDNEKLVELLCSYGSSRSVDLLAHYGDLKTAAAVFAANPSLADDPHAFAGAARGGHDSLARLILRYQPGLIKRVSVGAKTRELNEVLFEKGMDPSRPDWLGITPLHEFASSGDLERAAIFIEHGASLRARDDDIRSTPLGWAAKFGQKEMVQLLLDCGAKTNLPDDPPWATPLAWAQRRGHREIAERLKQRGARE
jgi:ankyrin repeat protein